MFNLVQNQIQQYFSGTVTSDVPSTEGKFSLNLPLVLGTAFCLVTLELSRRNCFKWPSITSFFHQRNVVALASQASNETPLHKASALGQKKVVLELLTQGADIEAVDEYGNTPLHKACANGHTEVVIALLDQGAQIESTNNSTNSYGWTPLHIACRENRAKIIKEFINRKANIHAQDANGRSPFHLLLEPRQTASKEAVNTLQWIAGILYSFMRRKGTDCRETVYALLDAGANFSALDFYNRNPLAFALQNESITEDLIADFVKKTDEACMTDAIFKAIFHYSPKSSGKFEILMKHCDVNARENWYSHTFLHQAIIDRNLNAVKFFLAKGADVNVQDKDGYTPLHYAAMTGKKEFVDVLLEKGANKKATSRGGLTPAQCLPDYQVLSACRNIPSPSIDLLFLLESQ